MSISAYSIVLFIHVLGAVAWIGSVLAFETLGTRVTARGDAAEGVAFARDHAFFTRTTALPGALAIILTGGWLMQDGGFELETAWWIGAGIGIWVVAVLGSMMLRGPRLVRAAGLAETEGADSEEVRWRIRQVRLLARGELMLLTLALFLMVAKPS